MKHAGQGASPTSVPIAITGMACLFPRAGNLREFWRVIRRGEDGITEVPATHWSAADYFDADPAAPDMTYCTRGGFLDAVPFDPTEFGIPPSNLEATDTSQLLALVAARAALQDAGYESPVGNRCHSSPVGDRRHSASVGDQCHSSPTGIRRHSPPVGNGCNSATRPLDRDRVAVILGITGTQELVLPLTARLGHPIWRRALREAGVEGAVAEDVVRRIADAYVPWQENSFPGLLGNVVAGRIANRLNLRGMNCVVDAACASSLSAVHLAMLELAAGRCDVALSGGVDTLNDIFMFMCFSKTPALSPTGDARPFSVDADGTVIGEGVGIVVLKRLEDARRDGDRIYAVIRGLGTSSDGRSQSIYAPDSGGQERALRNAYRLAGVDPATVELVEAHGTGTKVGDAAEFAALRTVYGAADRRGPWCALGSVKAQIGHTKAAAGAAGLIKAALALHHRTIPPTIKIKQANPKLDIERSPFYLNTAARPWLSAAGGPRRAALSSFGFGGSNYHLVLEEADGHNDELAWDGSVEIIALAGRSVDELADGLRRWRDDTPRLVRDQSAVAREAAASRRSFSPSAAHRLVLVVERDADLSALFERAAATVASTPRDSAATASGLAPDWYYGDSESTGGLAFLFAGQGSQYVNMGRDAACLFPEMRAAIEEADAAAAGRGAEDDAVAARIYPRPAASDVDRAAQTAALKRTDIAQPALGAVELGWLRILERFGVRPDMTAGHSYGELVALHAAGCYDAATLLALSHLRGRVMAAQHGGDGAMLAVSAPLDDVARLVAECHSDIVLSNRNAPRQGVLSGRRCDLEIVAKACAARGFAATWLPVGGAFHHPMMAGAVEPLKERLARVSWRPPRVPVYSNTTGGPYPHDAASEKALLGEQLLRPVDFVGMIDHLYNSGARTFVEIGPKATLTGLIRAILGSRRHAVAAVDASAGRGCGVADLARVLALLAARGHGVDLTRWERPPPPARQSRMTVPLVGANYRSSGGAARRANGGSARPSQAESTPAATPRASTPRSSDAIVDGDPVLTHQANGNGRDALAASAADPPNRLPDPAASPSPPDAARSINGDGAMVSDAMRLVQEGLRAMLALQQQTAEAHRRFLDGQEAAQRTLQQVLGSQQRLLGRALGLPGPAVEAGDSDASPVAPPDLATTAHAEPVEVIIASATPTTPKLFASPAAAPGPDAERSAPIPVDAPSGVASEPPAAFTPSSANRGRLAAVEALVLGVVAEKTGYPLEMLAPEMDIEADLGIDSIKRVEIVAAVEERLPDGRSIAPDQMGALRTLRQVIEFVSGASASGAVKPTGGHPSASCDTGGRRFASPTAEAVGHPSRFASPTVEAVGRPSRLAADEPVVTGPAAEVSASATSEVLLAVVSELTGYPREMLNLDMDLESDLGIDSIKRVEILAAVEARAPEFKAVNPEHLGALRTLRQIAEYGRSVTRGAADDAPVISAAAWEHSCPASTAAAGPCRGTTGESDAAGADEPIVERRKLVAAPLPDAPDGDISIAPDHAIRVTDDHAGVSRAIVQRLAARGVPATLVDLDAAHDEPRTGSVGGLVIVCPPRERRDADWRSEDETFLGRAFALTRRLSADLRRAAEQGGSLLATVSWMDGAFGLTGGAFDPTQGGLAGLVKTAALEWPSVRCRAIDVAPSWRNDDDVAAAVVRELSADGPVEVGLDRGVRRGLALELAPATARSQAPIGRGDVVVVTGGARGVAAASALELARKYGPLLVLLGRTEVPKAEPPWLAGLSDEPAIKRAILAHDFADRPAPTPAELGAAFARRMAEREVRENLARISAAGSQAAYRRVDVRDAAAVNAAMNDVRATIGPIRGLIHAAGVIADRRIEDKTPEQFAEVLSVKVGGLRHLLDAVAHDDLRFIALFSSVAARFGNVGQADYATANEVLNKAAQRLAGERPGVRVVSINWGPWDGGMVGPELKRAFEQRGVSLIPMEAGARGLVRELGQPASDAVEVVIGSGLQPASQPEDAGHESGGNGRRPPKPERKTTRSAHVAFDRVVAVDTHAFLQSHVLDGRPVLPFAMTMEWLAHAALHENPGLVLRGFDDLRVLKGVVLNNGPRPVRVVASDARRDGSDAVVDVELRSGDAPDGDVVHVRGRAVLGERHDRGGPFVWTDDLTSGAYARGIDAAYLDVLFHGPHLRGIERIDGVSPRGLVARLRPAPPPCDWMDDALRTAWITDPLAIDSAFQLAILWCDHELDAVCLPHYVARYRQFRDAFPADGVSAAMHVREHDRRRLRADVTFVGGDGATVARIDGLECTVDAALKSAFRRNAPAGAAR